MMSSRPASGMLKNASVAAITKPTSTPANIPNKMYFFAKRPPCLTPFPQRRRYALVANDQFAPSVSASPVRTIKFVNYSGRSLNFPSFTVTSTRARSSIPL